jgi:hypothetical protein
MVSVDMRDKNLVLPTWEAPGPRVTPAFLDRTAAGLFALFILAVAVIALVVPEREWDLVAYVALTIEDQHDTPEALHAATWEIVRQNTTDKEFTLLTRAGDYRRAQFGDADNLVSQLPMYRVKPGYIALLKTLSPIFGPVGAIQAVNAASALLLGTTLLLWMRRGDFLQGALFLAPLMMLGSLVSMARLGTPDLLVASLTVTGTMLLSSRRGWAGVPVLLTAFLVRPDTLIFLFALVLASLACGWRRLPALTAFVVAAILSIPLSSGADHIGWWPHFWFSTVEMQNDLADFRPDFSIAVYFVGVARGLAMSAIAHRWLPMAGLLLLLAWLLLRQAREIPRDIAMPMLAMVLAVGGKFAVFPLPDDRIYAAFLWMFAMGLLELWRPQLVSAAAPAARP